MSVSYPRSRTYHQLRRQIQVPTPIPRVGASGRKERPLFISADAYSNDKLRRVGVVSRSPTVYRNDFLIDFLILFQITNLMHNSFILQQYVRYTMILNMFRAVTFSSSGGKIVLLQPLVSSPSVNSRTV